MTPENVALENMTPENVTHYSTQPNVRVTAFFQPA